jgi:hypothetical protein
MSIGPRDRHYYRTTRARETGRPVITGHADDLELDACGGDCRWYNICVDHGIAVGHRTLELARSFAAVPTKWCEDCRLELAAREAEAGLDISTLRLRAVPS